MKYNLSDFSCSKELELMLICSKPHIFENNMIIAKKLYLQADSNELKKMINRHRIIAFEYKNFLKLSKDVRIDESFLTFIADRSKNNQIRAMQYSAELIRLNNIFFENHIGYITLKGPLLGHYIYGDPGLRNFHDLDILINVLDFDKAYALLCKAGYKNNDFADMTEKQKRFTLKNGHHISMSNSSSLIVELHWRAYEYYDLSYNQLWDNKSEITFLNKKFYILNETDNLIYLIIHGSKHGFMRLKWLIDIRDIFQKETTNMSKLYKRADKLKCTDMLNQTLILLDFFFKTHYCQNQNITKHQMKLAVLALPIILSDDYKAEFGSWNFILYIKYTFNLCNTPIEKIKFICSFLKPKKPDFDGSKNNNFFMNFYLFRFHRILKKLFHIICFERFKKDESIY